MSCSRTERMTLPDADLLARGSLQSVYRHPFDPALVVKVIRPEAAARRAARADRPLRRFLSLLAPSRRRFRAYRSWQLQEQEYLAIVARIGAIPAFLPRPGGYVATRLGPGLVSERINGADGELAPTMREALKQTNNRGTLQALAEHLLDQLLEARAMFNDLHASNVVVESSTDGGERLVLIDGLRADTTLLPLRTLSDRAYRYWFSRNRERFRARLLNPGLKRTSARR